MNKTRKNTHTPKNENQICIFFMLLLSGKSGPTAQTPIANMRMKYYCHKQRLTLRKSKEQFILINTSILRSTYEARKSMLQHFVHGVGSGVSKEIQLQIDWQKSKDLFFLFIFYLSRSVSIHHVVCSYSCYTVQYFIIRYYNHPP